MQIVESRGWKVWKWIRFSQGLVFWYQRSLNRITQLWPNETQWCWAGLWNVLHIARIGPLINSHGIGPLLMYLNWHPALHSATMLFSVWTTNYLFGVNVAVYGHWWKSVMDITFFDSLNFLVNVPFVEYIIVFCLIFPIFSKFSLSWQMHALFHTIFFQHFSSNRVSDLCVLEPERRQKYTFFFWPLFMKDLPSGFSQKQSCWVWNKIVTLRFVVITAR